MTYDIINMYQYVCQKFPKDLSNPNFLCKIGIAWAAQGFTESGRSFRVFFSTIAPDLQNIGNFVIGATWEILTHPNSGTINIIISAVSDI